MPKLFRDLLKGWPADRKKRVEDRVRELLIEMKAADRCKIELGRDWEDLTQREQKRVIEEIKSELKEEPRVL